MLTDKNICDEFEFHKTVMVLLFTSHFGWIFTHHINLNEEHFCFFYQILGIVCTFGGSNGIFDYSEREKRFISFKSKSIAN